MSLPTIATPDEWRAARVALLEEEKAMTRARDALNVKRRQLPMVRVEKDYRFQGPERPGGAGGTGPERPGGAGGSTPPGTASLLELFDGRRQLMVGHFMFDPEWDDGCSSCTAGAEEMSDGLLAHLHTRETTFAYVSRAPIGKINAYKAKKGWTFPWYSSFGSDFNYDFHVTLDARVAPVEYNYRDEAALVAINPDWAGWAGEQPGLSCFLRIGDEVFHTYSQFARGAESTGGSYYFLDLTALGRQEGWEEPKGRADSARAAIPDFAT